MARTHEPLCAWTARQHWLKAAAAVALDAVPSDLDLARNSSNASAVAAVLFDHRIAAVGGRDGMPYSCASVYASLVARFRGGIAGQEIHRAPLGLATAELAFTHDMRSVIAFSPSITEHTFTEFDAATGARKHSATVWCDDNDEEYRLACQSDVFVAEDGFIFVSSYSQGRIHVLTPFPEAKLHAYVGGYDGIHSGYIWGANTVCATADFVLAGGATSIFRFSRRDARAPHAQLQVRGLVCCIRPLQDGKRIAFLTPLGIGVLCASDLSAPSVRFFDFDVNRYGHTLHFACSAYDEFVVLASRNLGIEADVTVHDADGTVFKTTTVKLTPDCTPWAAACNRTTVALVLGGMVTFWG